MNNNTHSLQALSFATPAAGGTIDLWPAVLNSDFADACQVGRARANEVLQYMRDNSAPIVLGHVIGAMHSKGVFDAAEIGFTQAIAESAMH